MAKFFKVKEIPTDLKKGDFVIDQPNFIPEIAKHASKAAKNGLTARFHLRLIVDTIGQAYDPEKLTGWVIKSHLFEGRKFSSNEELNKIIIESLEMSYPQIFNKYLEQKLKTRPAGTETIYFVDSPLYSDPEAILYKFGMNEQEDENAKPKKIVGRPAVTKEQAEALKANRE